MWPLYGAIKVEDNASPLYGDRPFCRAGAPSDSPPRSSRARGKGGYGMVWGLLVVVASVGIVYKMKGGNHRSLGFAASNLSKLAAANVPTIRATNSYTATMTETPGSSYPYTADYVMVEPYRETRLAVVTPQLGYTYEWTFPDGTLAWGPSVAHSFDAVGTYSFDLQVTDSNGNVVADTQHQVLSRYVRREIRSLSNSDLKDYLAAAKEVYNLKPSRGRKKYGSDFTSMQEISAIYNQLSSDTDCNHLSEGTGYMTSHAGLLLTYERSIQAVNPAVSVPYWDFTIDAEKAAESGSLSTFYKSEVFGASMFGEPSDWTSTKLDHMSISSGIFAKLKVRHNMWDYGLAHSPFGYARSPLNANPSSYVTRHSLAFGGSQSTPGCAEHYTAMQATSLESLHTELQGRAFEAIPLMVGGASNADLSFLSSQYNYRFVEDFAKGAYKAQWALHRKGLLSVQEYCVSSEATSCKPTCSTLDFNSITTDDAATILKEVHPLLATSSGTSGHLLSSKGEDLSVTLLQTLCNGFDHLQPRVGDFFDVPVNDPLFWSSFATIDRLWHWKRINGLEDTTWSSSSTCYGHSETDTVAGVYKAPGTSSSSYYSNADIMALTDPTTLNTEMTYLYDTFTWTHCAAAGIPTDLRDGTATTSLPTATSSTEV